MDPSVKPADVIRDQDKAMLVLSYLGLLALVPFLTVKDSDYVRWHARQGMGLALAWVVWFVGILVLGFIPFLNLLILPIGVIGHLGFLALAIIGIVKSFGPDRWRIPVIVDIGDKLAPYQVKAERPGAGGDGAIVPPPSQPQAPTQPPQQSL